MIAFSYSTGEDVRGGDLIRYHGEPGQVEFVVASATGDPTLDWYLKDFPGGVVMIQAEGFGSVLLRADDVDDELVLVAREVSSQ